MENLSKNNLFKESLLSTGNNTTLLKTIHTTEINNITNKKQNDIQEIYDKYNNLNDKIKLFLISINSK